VEPGHLVVVRLLEHQPAQHRPLDQVREEVTAALRNERAREAAQRMGQELQEKMAAGEGMAALADAETVQYQAPAMIQRNVRNHPAAVVAEVFRLPHPGEDGPARGGLTLDSGDYVVISLNRVEDGDPARMTDADRQQLRQGLASLYGAAEISALLARLKAEAKVVLPDEERR
jgi:peptidyl-prolyl cis-trans isomerase D